MRRLSFFTVPIVIAALIIFLIRASNQNPDAGAVTILDMKIPNATSSIVETVQEVIGDVVTPREKPEDVRAPAPNTGRLQVFGSIPYWDQPRAIAMFKKHVDDFDAITVFWYRLDANGIIGKYTSAKEDQALIDFAHARGVKVLPLIANLPDSGEWDANRVEKVINSPEARAAHIAAIMELVNRKGFDGANIDYEFLRDSQTEDFTAFIRELGGALHAEGKILKVAIHAQRAGGETRGQDLVGLAAGADYLSFMTYDQHWETSDPGANAEIGWMRDVLQHARNLGVPMNRVLLGVPLDGYNWNGEDGDWNEADGVDYASALKLAKAEGAEVKYNENVEAPFFTFGNSDGSQNAVWFENLDSFKAKYNLAKEFNVAGLALWKFGAEDERVYEFLDEK